MAASFDAAVSGFNKLQALQALALLKLTGVESHALRSALAHYRQAGSEVLPLLEEAALLLADLPQTALDWAQGVQNPPDMKAYAAWQQRWGSRAGRMECSSALGAFVWDQPGLGLLPEHERVALKVTLRALWNRFVGVVAAPPNATAFRARVEGARSVSEAYQAICMGGWLSPVPPDEHYNFHSIFHSARVFLTYAPRYSTIQVAPPDEVPPLASFEDPDDCEHWLHSVDVTNAVAVGIQLRKDEDTARAAHRLTPTGTPGLRHKFLSCPRLQLQFTDLAEHNHGTQPYRSTMSSQQVCLQGREPDWLQAHQHHAVRREQLAALPGNENIMSLYTGRQAVEFWRGQRRVIDVTRLFFRLASAVLEAAGHAARLDLGWGGLQGARVLLVELGGHLELVIITTHPCADQARACASGQVARGLLPHGVLQGLAAMAVVVLGERAGACFPPPEDMPTLFGQISAAAGRHTGSWRSRCNGCQFILNVQRVEDGQGAQLVAPGPCFGRCGPAGLLGLTSAQCDRLMRACRCGHFTTTELEFVRWTGVVPADLTNTLIGLHGQQREAMLRALMS